MLESPEGDLETRGLFECRWFIWEMILENTDGERGSEPGKRKKASAGY